MTDRTNDPRYEKPSTSPESYRRDPEFCPHTSGLRTFRQGKNQCLDCGTIIYDTYANYCEG